MAGNIIGETFIHSGRETISLAATKTVGPFGIGSARLVGVRCSFSSTGTFDAVGTLAVKVGPTAAKLSVISFTDDSGDTVTSKAVAAGDDATTFLFDEIVTVEGNIWVVYTSTSDGTDDVCEIQVLTKGAS